MIAVLVANTKGGCGKTTISTHIAAAFANAGRRTTLADADRQHSSFQWARLRPGTAAHVEPLDWVRKITDPPRGTERLVIDAAAAMKTKQVFELVRMADMIVVPVLASAFDQATTAAFLHKLNELKPIRKSRKPVAVVRNRVRPRTHAAARLARFLHAIEHQDLGALADRTIYNDVAAAGLSIFDLPGRGAETFRRDWSDVLDYVGIEDVRMARPVAERHLRQ
jgi:chromosome partitioning protein